MKTLLFSPPKFEGKFITVNDCCWGTGDVQVLQDRLLRTGSYLLAKGDRVGFLDAGMCGYSWMDVYHNLKESKPDRLIFQVVPQFESFQMTIVNICNTLGIEPYCIGITIEHGRLLQREYDLLGSYHLGLPTWDKMLAINFELLAGHENYVLNPVMQISEGCPYNCSFCVWGKKDFKMLPVDVAFENLVTYESNVPLYLLCSQITTNKKWLEDFVRLKEEHKLNFTYITDIHSKEITEDKIELLKSSGCEKVVTGVESTNPDILKKIGKKITIEDIENTIILCKKHDLALHVSFTYNIDSNENVDNDINLYRHYKSFTPSPGIVKAYPGTRLYDELPEEHDWIMELGTNPIATNKGLDIALEKLKKWESVL